MSLSEKIPSSRFSGLFLKNSNPEYDEFADAAADKQQKAMEKIPKETTKEGYDKEHAYIGCFECGNGGFE